MQDAYKNSYSTERVLTFEERINAITPEKLVKNLTGITRAIMIIKPYFFLK